MNCTYTDTGVFLAGADFTLQRDADIISQNNTGIVDKLPHAKINVQNNATTTTLTTLNIYYKAVFTNGFTTACKLGLGNGIMTYYPSYPFNLVSFISGNILSANNNRTLSLVLRRSLAITSVTGNGATVTVTSTVPHNLQTGSVVQMLGWTGGTGVWNRTGTVTVSSLTVFTYASTGNGTATGGTAGIMLSEMTIRITVAGQPFAFSFNTYLENMGLNEFIEPYVSSANNGDTVTIQDLTWLVKV
jgi:hypothetical protein